jgi:hypothetical protein
MKRVVVSMSAVVAVVAAVTTGCTQGTGAPGSTRPAPNDGTRSPGRDLTDAEQIVVDRAEQLLVKKCMERKGFRYWVGPIAGLADRRGNGYVLDDVAWAKRYGYGRELAEKARKAQENDPNHPYANGLPEAERIRYSLALEGGPSTGVLSVELPGGGTIGTPRGGCLAAAKGELYGDFPTWFRADKTVSNLTPLYVPDLVKDKRFVHAVAAWSACMREAGHRYADPPELREKRSELTKGLSAAQTRTTEVELAVAEATCATETSLGDTARALEREYRGRLHRYAEDIATRQRMALAALSRAEGVTGPTA